MIGTLFMDAAVQSSNLLGQSVIYELLPQARSRLTAVYMTTMFIGGSLGSWAAAHAYERWGWAGACAAAAAFPAIGLLGWLAARRHEGVKNIFGPNVRVASRNGTFGPQGSQTRTGAGASVSLMP